MPDPPRRKELKVTLPATLYLALLRHKLLHGQTIAATMEAALERHFAALERRP